jgi:hypothetical protein
MAVCTIESLCILEQQAVELWDRVGKDKFRQYCSLDSEAIQLYKNRL